MDLILPGGVSLPSEIWLPVAGMVFGGAVAWSVGRLGLRRERTGRQLAEHRAREEHRRATEARQELTQALRAPANDPHRRLLQDCARFAAGAADVHSRRELGVALADALERMLRPRQSFVYATTALRAEPLERVVVGGEVAQTAPQRLGRGAGRLVHVLQRGVVMEREDFEGEPELLRRRLAEGEPDGFEVDVAAPVLGESDTALVFGVGGSTVPPLATRLAVEVLCGIATSVVRTLDARERVAHAEAQDSLTGMVRRTVFVSRAEDAVVAAAAAGTPAAVVLFEIDDLARHEAAIGPLGMELLIRRFAGVVRHAVRPDDLLARWSSRHFVALLRDVDERGAFAAFERVRLAVEARDWSDVAAVDGRLTISGGIATSPSNGTELEALWETASQNLAAANWGGGNQISVLFVERVEDAPTPLADQVTTEFTLEDELA